jgi:NAD(P)H-hydrate epimerase
MSDRDDLAALVQECGEAHHKAYAESDGADPDWALWYAPWLQARSEELSGRTRSELTYLLVKADKARADAGDEPWPELFARILHEG